MDIPEALIHIMYDSIFFTARMEQRHQFFIPLAEDVVGKTVFVLVYAAKPGEIAIQRPIIIFTVSVTQSHPGIEADDSLHSGANAVVQMTGIRLSCNIFRTSNLLAVVQTLGSIIRQSASSYVVSVI